MSLCALHIDLYLSHASDFAKIKTSLRYSYSYDQQTYGNTTLNSRVIADTLYPASESRLIVNANKKPIRDEVWESSSTISTIMSTSSEKFPRIYIPYKEDVVVSITTGRPSVDVQCWHPWINRRNDIDLDRSGRLWTNNGTLSDMLPGLRTMINGISDVVDLRSRGEYCNCSSVTFSPIWFPSPEPGLTSTITIFLSAVVDGQFDVKGEVRPDLVRDLINVDGNSTLYQFAATACKISPYWITSEVPLIRYRRRILILAGAATTLERSQARAITLSVVGSEALNTTALRSTINELTDDWALNVGGEGGAGWDQAGILAATIAMWLSEMPDLSQVDWHYLDAGALGKSVNESNNISIRIVTKIYGFGYGTRSTSIYLSMVVLSFYCLVTVIYVLYIWITGTASTAWNSGIELVALALQSRKPDHLGHTGVGINSTRTYAEGVGVRVNKNDELELVFAHDRHFETSGLRKLTRNREY